MATFDASHRLDFQFQPRCLVHLRDSRRDLCPCAGEIIKSDRDFENYLASHPTKRRSLGAVLYLGTLSPSALLNMPRDRSPNSDAQHLAQVPCADPRPTSRPNGPAGAAYATTARLVKQPA